MKIKCFFTYLLPDNKFCIMAIAVVVVLRFTGKEAVRRPSWWQKGQLSWLWDMMRNVEPDQD